MELGSLTVLSGVLGKHPSPLNLPRLCFTSKTPPKPHYPPMSLPFILFEGLLTQHGSSSWLL